MLTSNSLSRSMSSLKRPASGSSVRTNNLGNEPVNLSRASSTSGLPYSGRFSVKGDDCLRDIDFNDDDTCTYVSSTTMREIFPELETIPVRDKPGGDMQGFYDRSDMFTPRQTPVRGMHDVPMTSVLFPDNDSGFSSIKARGKNLFADNDFMMSSPRSSLLSQSPMRRSRSMTKLNGSFTSQDFSPPVSSFHKPIDRSIRHLKDNLEDSENRRAVLMHKLKEAQDTLELQGNRLGKIENTAKGNSFLVEDLQLKERDYRDKIKHLEKGQDEREMLKFENIRLREEMQDRIDKLDFQLRSLQAQHQVVENENQKRINLLDQSSSALCMLEEENNHLKKERDVMKSEIAVAKEAMQLARNRFEPLEDENKSLRMQVQELQKENAELSKKLSELTGQLMELRKLTQSMKDENEKLASAWKSVSEDKQSLSRQLEGAQTKLSDLKTRATSTSTEKDKLFTEKMDLNNKFQQLMINKEQLERAKSELEEQLYHQEHETERLKVGMKKREDEKNKKEDQIYEINKKNQELAAELGSVKSFYERALEQISTLENGKKATNQQQEWIQQENSRLKNEVDRLGKMADARHRELKKENEHLEANLGSFKEELRQLRSDKTASENKIHELETKLRKANEDIKKSTSRGQQELDTWKDTCDRLTASVSRKEAEIQELQDKCLDHEDLIGKQQDELRTLKEECETLSEHHDDVKKLKDENRKLHQEKAENEQMIKLLETQKEVLTQSTESQLAKMHDAEHLTGKVEQLRHDKEQLRERVLELEKVRDNLVRQKEELLASTELIYKKPKLEELENKIEELREANKQLRDINENINERYETLEEQYESLQSVSNISKQKNLGDRPHNRYHSSPIFDPKSKLKQQPSLENQGLVKTSESGFQLETIPTSRTKGQSPKFNFNQGQSLKPNRPSMRTLTVPRHTNSECQMPIPIIKVEQVPDSDESYHMKQSSIPKDDHERVVEMKEEMENELDHLKREYDSLQERHKQYMEDYGPDGEEAQRDKDKIRGLEKEKDGLEKQVALINGQLLLVESSKKRLDEIVEDLQVEIVHLRKELEEAEKQPMSGPELEQMQAEVELLRDELSKTQTDKQKQLYLIKTLKEEIDEKSKNPSSKIRESLDDVGSELHEMRDELHKLMGVIQSKDQAIETLENQLRHSKETVESREKEMQELQTIMTDIEAQKSMEVTRTSQSVEEGGAAGERKSRSSRIPRRTEDGKSPGEDAEFRRHSRQKYDNELKTRLKPAESFMTMQKSKRLLTAAKPAPGKNVAEGQYGTKFLSKPQRSLSASDKGSDRLQSLISKYRNHGEGSQFPERKIKPLSLSTSNKMGLVTRGRSFGPAAPKGSDGKVSRSSRTHIGEEGVGTFSETALKRVSSPHGDDGPVAQSSPTPEDNVDSDILEEGDVAVGLNFDADTEDDLDTQEQKDIDSLIQKRATHPKPILSVNPPKLTSKVIADLLKTNQQSRSPGSASSRDRSKSLPK